MIQMSILNQINDVLIVKRFQKVFLRKKNSEVLLADVDPIYGPDNPVVYASLSMECHRTHTLVGIL